MFLKLQETGFLKVHSAHLTAFTFCFPWHNESPKGMAPPIKVPSLLTALNIPE